jgi:hypothetical protein
MAGTKKLSQIDASSLKIVNLADGSASTDGASTNQVTNAQNFAISRANHTGTQLASTVSNFDTQVRTSRLDQMAVPTASVAFNSQKITGLLDPSNPQDGATKNYVDTATAAITSGLVLKGSVRAATSVNTTLSAPGTTIDGLTAVTGEIYILMGQTTTSQNGPWVFNGSAAAMTRPTNWTSGTTATIGSFWDVREGTNADTFALLVTVGTITIDTTAVTFVVRGSTSASTGFTATCPTTTAGGTWTVTHNLNTKWLVVQVARTASPYDFVDVRVERTTVNTVSVMPDVALVAGDYEVMVQKVA